MLNENSKAASLVLVWGNLLLYVLIPLTAGVAILGWIALLVVMWRKKATDSYLDWNVREVLRANVAYSLYGVAWVVVSLALSGLFGLTGALEEAVSVVPVVILCTYMFVFAIWHVINVHRRQYFVYPLTRSPRQPSSKHVTWLEYLVLLAFTWLCFWAAWEISKPAIDQYNGVRNQRAIEQFFGQGDSGTTGRVEAPRQQPIEDHLLAANSQIYLCDTEARVRDFYAKATTGNFFTSMQQLDSYSQAYCPRSAPTALVAGTVVHDEIGQMGAYNQLRIVAVNMQQGSPRYSVLVRNSETGLWHDAVTMIVGARTLGGVMDWLDNLNRQ